MSRSLQLRNGDLVVGGAQLGEVTGGQKLVQDLRCALLEPRGHDDAHPTYGSLLDGGVDEFGREVPSIIGGRDWERAALRVRGEIQRIAQEHQRRQLERARSDRLTYGESTLIPAELLVSIANVELYSVQDTLLCRVTLQTGANDLTRITLPLSNEPVLT